MTSRAPLLAPLLAVTVLCSACEDQDATPATQIIVAVTSDLEVESELTRIEVTVSSRDGEEVAAMRDYALVREDPDEGRHQLPLTFSVAKGEASSFLIEVVGYGPLRKGGEDERIVEQRAIATFRPRTSLLLRLFLGRVCLGNFCDGDDELVCYPEDRVEVTAGACGKVPVFDEDDLEEVDLNDLPDFDILPFAPDAGRTDAGADAAIGGSDAGADAGCQGEDCPCTDAADCDDGMFCTTDSCDGEGTCRHEARDCSIDDNACTSPPVCNEETDACEEPFDESSLSSTEHCGASATSSCEACAGDGTRSARCEQGQCELECADGKVDADGQGGNGCECTFVSEQDLSDDDAIDTNCDGADAVVGGGYTLYVTAGGSGDHSGGSPANAATLEEAFALATAGAAARELLLAAGDYAVAGPLVASDELVLFGGYAEDFRSRSGRSKVIASGSTALRIANAPAGVVVDSIDFATADQSAPGTSTSTVVVDSSHALFRRAIITAGAGAPGLPGDAGTAGAASTVIGEDGHPAPSNTGGGPGGATGPGGNGGMGGNYIASVPSDGIDGSPGTRTATGCGGPGMHGAGESFICLSGTFNSGNPGSPGQPGCAGTMGTHGSGGMGPGTIVGAAWVAPLAQGGGTGQVGGSGGGGGGGGAGECAVGGAGGGGGSPGGAGGASIAIVAYSATLAFEMVELHTGNGGSGGRGGDGGAGGNGAAGGAGGTGQSNSSGSPPTGAGGGTGGRGGNGGKGGPGGCGGGGVGGASVGLLRSTAGTGVSVLGTPIVALGSGGAAGPACSAGGGNAGSAGVQESEIEI